MLVSQLVKAQSRVHINMSPSSGGKPPDPTSDTAPCPSTTIFYRIVPRQHGVALSLLDWHPIIGRHKPIGRSFNRPSIQTPTPLKPSFFRGQFKRNACMSQFQKSLLLQPRPLWFVSSIVLSRNTGWP